MGRFYGEVTGSRGTASRLGTAHSGMTAHVRGWNLGVAVVCEVQNGQDVIYVYRTGGSNDSTRTLIATLPATTADSKENQS